MRLADVVAGLPIAAAPAGLAAPVEVRGVAHDSRRVQPGDLFIVWAGQRFDGRRFAGDAIARGAVAVLAPGPALEPSAVPWLTASEPRRLLAPIAARVYGHPDRELVLAGVTGTNGKSTVAVLLRAMLGAAGRPCGLLGTLGYEFAGRSFPGDRTTPEASDLFAVLRAMRDAGATAAAMEVSSHALAQGRVGEAAFDVAVFTNLTRDHFDFHPDFEDYFRAKRRLFEMLKPGGRRVTNVADPWGERLRREFPDALGYRADGQAADVWARDVELDSRGVRGILVTPRGELPFATALRGRFNLENLLAAAAGAESLGLPHAAIAAALGEQRPLSGRMEPVERGQEFPVFVDYADTDAALAAALGGAREFTRRKLIVVFGCGGDRDPGKRPLMGRVAGELAELPIATSDNPRSEDPLVILQAVERGLRDSGNRAYRIVPDRREAIRGAIAVAAGAPGEWAVVVAGKGHEAEQIVGSERLPFSDRDELAKALEERLGPAADR